MKQAIRLTVLTQIPSPYQVEFLDSIDSDARFDLRVVYVKRRDPSRAWRETSLRHEHCFLDGPSGVALASRWIQDSDFSIFSWYADRASRQLMAQRSRRGRQWAFWGERPGFGGLGFVGSLRRRWLLSTLHSSSAPIFGIGSWAIDGWRREFGGSRRYVNIPYFSNIERFRNSKRSPSSVVRILFSGSLSHRKGVDLIAAAFSRIAGDVPNTQLSFLGSGKLQGRIKNQLRHLGGRVEFLGFRDWDELPSIYASCNLLLAPSRYDGWGLIVPEALAAGMPVIASSKVGAAKDLIREAHNGWIFPSGDSRMLGLQIKAFAQMSPQARFAMSSNSVASVEHHSLENGVDRLFEAIDEEIRLNSRS